MEFERSKRPVRAISLIPLINVIFLVLIFFMVTGTMEKVEVIDVDLPEAVSGELLDEGHIQILMGRYDEIVINEKPVHLSDIESVITQELKHNKERVITMKADARAKASRMIEIMDRIKAAGGKNLSLTTQEL